jgi:hypothetical protein
MQSHGFDILQLIGLSTQLSFVLHVDLDPFLLDLCCKQGVLGVMAHN